MSEKRSLKQIFNAAFLGLLGLGVPLLFFLAFVTVGASSLFDLGKKVFTPEAYWNDKVSKIEDRIKKLSAAHSQCQTTVIEGDQEGAKLYQTFIRQGWRSDQAVELVMARRKGLENTCMVHLQKMILEAPKYAEAKAKLQEHSR